jgi:hypothetical protein
MRAVGHVGQLAVFAGLLCLTGCSSVYMQNRGNDLSQIFNVGVTVSETPQFSLYFSMFGLTPIGYSDFDGTLHGYANETTGAFKARHHALGLLLWSREQYAWGDRFEPEDADSPPSWRNGLIGIPLGPYPPKRETLSAPKSIHLGWLGITLYCRFGEMADFLLGWFGSDIMGDDTAGQPEGAADAQAPDGAESGSARRAKGERLIGKVLS